MKENQIWHCDPVYGLNAALDLNRDLDRGICRGISQTPDFVFSGDAFIQVVKCGFDRGRFSRGRLLRLVVSAASLRQLLIFLLSGVTRNRALLILSERGIKKP